MGVDRRILRSSWRQQTTAAHGETLDRNFLNSWAEITERDVGGFDGRRWNREEEMLSDDFQRVEVRPIYGRGVGAWQTQPPL